MALSGREALQSKLFGLTAFKRKGGIAWRGAQFPFLFIVTGGAFPYCPASIATGELTQGPTLSYHYSGGPTLEPVPT